jgi:predicted AAA+ superfamily ATPase
MSALKACLDNNPVVALMGPRQCGKTTLARELAAGRKCEFFDLEDPVDSSRLDNPLLALRDLRGLVVIDEIQRRPELFSILRVLVDRPANEATFLILGSAAPRLVKGAAETLAGRVGFVDLSGFDMSEVGEERIDTLWHRGGFPRSFLAPSDAASHGWRRDFIRTFLERDVPSLGISIPAETLRRFWTMVAHYHGQVWNAAEFARSIGSAEATARRYLDILSGSYMVRQLQPWHANLKKRQLKSPKIYVRDSGVLHALLSLETATQVASHPKLGASWEGFAIEQIIAATGTREAYFWGTHAGAELDLLIFEGGRALGFEIKYVDVPSTTRSMRTAIADLGLGHLYVVYPGEKTFPLDEDITAVPLSALRGRLAP